MEVRRERVPLLDGTNTDPLAFEGLALGYKSCIIPVFVLSSAIFVSFQLCDLWPGLLKFATRRNNSGIPTRQLWELMFCLIQPVSNVLHAVITVSFKQCRATNDIEIVAPVSSYYRRTVCALDRLLHYTAYRVVSVLESVSAVCIICSTFFKEIVGVCRRCMCLGGSLACALHCYCMLQCCTFYVAGWYCRAMYCKRFPSWMLMNHSSDPER